MSLTQAQRNIINNVKSRDFSDVSIFLNGASEVKGKAIEEEALTLIGDRSNPLSDKELIKLIAKWDQSNDDRVINFYNLMHKSCFSTSELDGHNEFSCTAVDEYINIAQGVVDLELPQDQKLNEYTRDQMFCIDTSANPKEMYYIGEHNKLYGKSKDYGWSYSTSTAACIKGYNIPNPIVFDGYCFESMYGRTNYATGGASRRGEYFFLTPGGGPVIENNPNYPYDWIIQFNEYNIRTVRFPEDIYSSTDSDWVIPNGKDNEGNPRYGSILKLWIHLFFPDGKYVRCILDRSDSANFNSTGQTVPGLNPSMKVSWIYSDYSNNPSNINFKSIWNNRIYNKQYRPLGGYNPKILDTSHFWNGKLNENIQKNQRAYDISTHQLVWSGGGSIV